MVPVPTRAPLHQQAGQRTSAGDIPLRPTLHSRLRQLEATQTLITQSLRLLAVITSLGTTGTLIPRSLNASRMRAAWMASIHAIPASSSIMAGDFNFIVSDTYPTAAPTSSASASLAMLTSLSRLPSPLLIKDDR